MSQTTAKPKGDDAQAHEPAEVHVETGGDLFRSLTGLLDPLVEECKVRFDANKEGEDPEVSVTAVDPANVGMISVHVPAEAFEVYEVPEDTTLGLNLDELESITDYARKGGNSRDNPGDPVVLEKVGKRIYARVEPEDKWNRTGSFFQIDPNAIRQEPDLPALDLPWSGKVEATNLRDALKGVSSWSDHAALSAVVEESGNGSLGEQSDAYLSVYSVNQEVEAERTVHKEDEFRSEEKVLHADSASGGVASLYSLDYLTDMADAIVKAGFDRVGIDLGDEFPVRLRFGGAKWGVHGTYMLAPRIQSDSDGAGQEWEATWGDRFESDDDEDADEEDA